MNKLPRFNFITELIQMITHIRFNLKQCLRQWEASDKSALSVLRPWRSVWSPAEWDQFMLQNIYPKLEKHLRGLLITVETVKADEIDHVQLWHEMLPMTALLKLFDEAFFPKWLIVLKAWLSSTTVRFQLSPISSFDWSRILVFL